MSKFCNTSLFQCYCNKNQKKVPHLFLDNERLIKPVLHFLLNYSILAVCFYILGKWVHGFGQNQVQDHGLGQN